MVETHIGCRFASWLAAGLVCIFTSAAATVEADGVAVKKIVSSLKNPQSVAIRPDGIGGKYEIFIAESGAGRIIKIRSDQPEKPIDVVSGFSTKSASETSSASAGVYSVLFLDHLRLAAAGGDADGTPFVRLYELAEPESPRTSDQFKHEARLPEAAKEADFKPHLFCSLARTQANDRVGDIIVAAAPAEGQPAGMVYVPIRAGTLGESVPARFEGVVPDFHIGGMAVGKSGYVTTATNFAADPARSSRLTFFSPLDRRIVMQLPTELSRIVGLAYSPKTGNLYVANAATAGNYPAGIYRIDRSTKPDAAVAAVKITEIPYPTALAFAVDGSLYVTAWGDGKDSNAGSLWVLPGNL